MTSALRCPACDASGALPVFRCAGVPVHSTVLLDDAAAARRFPRRDLELALCRACGLAFNHLFEPEAMAYSPDLEESQHFSTVFSAFAADLVQEIAARCRLNRDSHIVEIGCGKGEFLTALCRAAGAHGVGIDPSFRGDRDLDAGEGSITFIANTFGPGHVDDIGRGADLVLCRHTLEHIGPVHDFVAAIAALQPRMTFFETPGAHRIFAEAAFWDIYYEHAAYFTPGSHARLFRSCGFGDIDVRLDYGDQYIVQYARQIGGAEPPASIEDDLDEIASLADTLAGRIAASIARWSATIEGAVAAGRQVALWGGSSKAVAFLNALPIATEMLQVVDKNPFKQGRYLPGSGHRVVAPAELASAPPGLVIAMNPIYRDEIRRDLADLGLAPEFVALGT